ncbi:MAG: hypothetical protein RMM58_15315 [Chloroflexota bacterium]|nr:hypothetical protein [Dehalococcoidia bacterium]MDW8255240.1 hypothetical protein [Chloroflexota bacterium]
MKRLRAAAGAVVGVVFALVVGTLALRPSFAAWLEAVTGEKELRFQVVNLLSAFSYAPLDTADEALIQHETVPFGMNVFLEQEVEEWKLRYTFDLLQAAKVRWIRQQIPWSDIEVEAKGDFETEYGSTWAKYDRFIDLANEYGIQILARLDSPPNWSRADNRVHNRPPDNFDDYGDFVEAFVTRYRGKVNHFQIWNEPNIFPEWGWQPADAGAYATLLRVAWERAKAANPDAVIVAAALAPTLGTEDGFNENDLIYLQKLYDAGGGRYFDVMSAMGYSLWTGPRDRRADFERVNLSRVRLIRDVMVRNGDAHKPIWIAELGWNALPIDAPIIATHGQVSREMQARYLADAYRRIQEEWPWVGVVFTWHLRMVHDENRDQPLYYFGLLDADFAVHPAYYAYQRVASDELVVYPGRRSESHPAISVSGAWRYERDDAADGWVLRSSAPGDALAFRFRGTSAALVVRRGEGRARVLVNGRPAPLLPDGQLNVESGSGWETVTLADRLPDGEHRVDVVVEDGRLAFDGVVVRRRDDTLATAAVGLAVAAVTLLGGVFFLGGLMTDAVVRRRRLAASPRRRWVRVLLPAELWDELVREVPPDRRQPFVIAAVAEALRRRRSQPAPADAEALASAGNRREGRP